MHQPVWRWRWGNSDRMHDEYRYGANDGYNLRLCFRLARAARSRCMSDHQIISTGPDPPWIRGHVIISLPS